MNRLKHLYTILLSTLFLNNNIISMEQLNDIEQESQLSSLPAELMTAIINETVIQQVKETINNSYNDIIFNKPKTIKVNLQEIALVSRQFKDVLNVALKSSSFKNPLNKLIKDLRSKRFDELFEALKYQSIEEYNGLSKEDLNKALINILNKALSLISKENFKQVVKLILAGANVNATDEYGQTSLMKASKKGHKEIVEMLIKVGADVNIKDNDGETALIIACHKDKNIVEMLIEAGADVNATDNNGSTALIWAIEFHHKEIVELLIRAKADIDMKDNDGKTALMFASLYDYKEIVEILIKAGADVNATDNNGSTALTISSLNGHEEILEMLINAQVLNKI